MKLPKILNPKIYLKLFSILLLSIGIVSLFLYLNDSFPKLHASWYNSSWFYKKPVTITNSGSTLTNEDVLLTVDTQTLVSQSKLQSDCDDLRFVDNNDSTALSYWIEGGCNTSSTKVWVRIPSLPNGAYVIYMYYGNPSATNGQASWSGVFYGLSDTSCTNGWTRDASFDGRFIYGQSTSGSTGGTAGSHNHGSSFSITSSAPSVWHGVGGDTEEVLTTNWNHTHPVSGTISSVSSLSPYLDTFICQKSEISQLNNIIMYSSSSTPSGWTRMSTFDSRFARGASSYGGTGGASSHTHTLSSLASAQTTARTNYDLSEPSPYHSAIATSTHTHVVSVSSNPAQSNLPPYKRLLYVKAPFLTTLDQNLIFLASATPPLGWTQYSTMNGYFLMGASAANLTALGASTHSHSIGLSLAASTSHQSWNASSIQCGGYQHTHSATLSKSDTNIPPYKTAVYIERKTSITNISFGSEEVENATPTAPDLLTVEGVSNPTRVTDTTPEFRARYNDPDTSDVAKYYEIEVNTNSSFTGTVMWDSGKTSMADLAQGATMPDKSYGGSSLTTDGTTYYWRIRFWDAADAVSPWSTGTNTFEMNTLPSKPTNLLAEGVATPTRVTDLTPEFSAIFNDSDSGDTGNYYQIQVNTQSDFLGTSMWDSGQQSMTATANGARSPDISYAGTALTVNGNTYYWRIRFTDNYLTVGEWSDPASFTMNNSPTAPSSLLLDGQSSPAKTGSLTPTFSAIFSDSNGSDTGTYYEIEVNSNSSFTGTVMWDTGKTIHSPAINNGSRSSNITYGGVTLDLDATTYYWRIRFWDNKDAVSAWSSTAQFTMDRVPNAPTSLLTEGATNPTNVSDLTPEFSAVFNDPDSGDTGIYYEIEVNTNNTFTGTVMWESNKTSISPVANGNRSSDISYNGTPLSADGTLYYWRIKFWDASNIESDWSSSAYFRMQKAPDQPTDLLTDGKVNPGFITSTTPNFSAVYNDVNGHNATAYQIEVNTNSSFTGVSMWDSGKVSTTVSDGSRSPDYTYAGSTLSLESVTYYWRIRFWDSDDLTGSWSATATFVSSLNQQYFEGVGIKGVYVR